MSKAKSTENGGILAHLGQPRVLAPLLWAMFVALRLWDPAPIEALRLRVFDGYQQLSPRQPAENPTLVVAIDEESLAKYGQWPWPRSLVSDLIERLAAGGPAAIALSIVFAEPDRLSPHALATGAVGLDVETAAQLAALPNNDRILADTLINAPVVLGRGASPTATGPQGLPLPPPLAWVGEDPDNFVVAFPALVRNLAELESVAAGNGIFTLGPEPDGVVRRIPAVIRVGREFFPSLSVETLRVAGGEKTTLARVGPKGVESLRVGPTEIPTDPRARVWAYFARPGTTPVLSAVDILDQDELPVDLRGRTVVVGATAVGQGRVWATPAAVAMTGVEIHAQLTDMARSGEVLRRLDFALGVEFALATLTMALITLIIPALGAAWTLAAGALSIAILVAISWGLFAGSGLLLDVTYPALASFSLFLLLSYLNYTREEQRRRQVRTAFAQYLAPSVVAEVAEHPDRLRLGGENRELSILFCDVRGFTTLAERLSEQPERLTQLLTRLLTPVSETILNHRGTIDKYVGDSVMAFWNAPLTDDDHAARACSASLDVLEDVRRLNRELLAEGEAQAQTLSLGLGINSGRCIVGNLGTPQRFAYSAIGDPVNLAARLEAQTRAYGVDIIVGEDTANRVADRFALLELDLLIAKGRRSTTRIYALLGDKQHRNDPNYVRLQTAHSMFLSAYRKQDWDGATGAIAECRVIDGAPAELYAYYEERIAVLRTDPPPPDWDGRNVALTK